jgi:uncharacterized protein
LFFKIAGGLKKYKIPFVGLKQGIHHYEYLIDEDFFAEMEYSPVKKGRVEVKLELNKQDTLFVLSFDIEGSVEVPCDRCLEDYSQPVKGSNRLIIKLGEEAYEESDEIVVIPRDEYEIDVAQYIYEYITLLLPLKRVHPDDSTGKSLCDSSTLKKLNELSPGKSQEKTGMDPRWDSLRDFFKKN